MNYFSLSPNFSIPVQQTPQNFASRSLIQNQLVIRAIASALSNSLNNYLNAILAGKAASDTPKQLSTQPIPENPAPQTQETPTKKLAQMPLPLQKQNKNVLKQKSEIPKGKGEKKSKEAQALTTSQEVIPEKQQKSTLIKQQKNRKKSISDNSKPQPLKSSTVPTVDLVETAYLPAKILNCSQIDRMRELLLLRQVDQWNDKIKCRRDKRQLRLLNG